MSGPGRRFDPAEVRPDAGPGPSDAELAEAMVAARELEALSARDAAGPSVGFEDRVMAAVAAEPAPRVLARPGRNVRYGLLGGFVISVRDAWRVATGGGRPMVIRAQAMAFVLLVILATGALSAFAAVGAASLLSPGPIPTPRVPTRTVSPAPRTTPSPSVLPSPSPSPTGDETMQPGQPGEHAASTMPTDTSEPTGTDEAAKTSKPTRTPRAAETPEPTETDEAEPTDDDDDGGGGGGGGDDGDDGGSGGGDDGGSGGDDDSSGPGGD